MRLNKALAKQKIELYINAAYQWHQQGGDSLEEGFGKQMIELEEEILLSFGLPFMAQKYSDLMQAEGFSNENKEKRAEELIKILQTEAEIFLLTPIEKDTKLLVEARNELQDAVEVLPIIGITATRYNCFLYYDIFFRGIYNEDELLLILKKNETFDNLPETRIPHTYDSLIANNYFDRLLNEGLPFLNEYKEFLKYKESSHLWDDYKGNEDLGNYFGFPDVFDLQHFIVKHIHLKDENTCCITILIEIGKKTIVELTLWCTANIMRVIMLHAKYYSLAIPPLYVSSPKFLDQREVNIRLKEAIGKNIEIENIKIEIERLDEEDDEIKDPFAYVITSIEANENIPKIQFKEPDDDLPF